MKRPRTSALFLVLAILLVGFVVATREEEDEITVRYQVHRLKTSQQAAGEEGSFLIDADWDKPIWQNVEPLELTHFMGERPAHIPHTQAKLLYDDDAIYVIFRVEDRYVQAVAKENQDPVYLDSCVEFFFTPAKSVRKAYFNLEMNCGGTMLLHYRAIPWFRRMDLRTDYLALTPQDLAQVEIAHSQPKIVDPEIATPTVWTVEYRLPIEVLKKYYPSLVPPAPGVAWRANFYKCADETSHPHWLTWAKVDSPVINFHVPKSFGQLDFQ